MIHKQLSRMSLQKKICCSSAPGRLETHVPSILSELGSTGGILRNISASRSLSRKVAHDFSAPPLMGDRKEPPEWMVSELLKQNRRRHSVTLGDKALLPRRPCITDSTRGLCSLKIDETISLDELQELKRAFEEHEMEGLRFSDEKNFVRIVKKCLPNTSNAQIQELFKKIDYSGQGRISWGDLCAHMLLEYKEKEESVRRSKKVAFTLPATIRSLCHSIPVINIRSTCDHTIVTVQEDGEIHYWSTDLKPQMTKSMFCEGPLNRKTKWASDFTLMTDYNKLIIGTGDRELQFYELSSLDPYCQISGLETVPLTLDYCHTGADECYILYGDTQGCVNIISINVVGDTLRLWSKFPKTANVPSIAIDHAIRTSNVTFTRWKVHEDWVTEAKYFKSFKAVVSTSNEEASSLVIGCALPSINAEDEIKEIREACYKGKLKKMQLNWTPQLRAACDHTVFAIHKGVKTFDLCQNQSLLITGGMDRLIRLWNPYFSGKPTGILKGHSAPILYVHISSEDHQIFSVSSDGTVKIWDVQDQYCLFTAEPKASGIHRELSACFYCPAVKSLYIAAESMVVLSPEMRPQLCSHLTVSHNEPVMCCGYSEEFCLVVSCAEGSVMMKVWDFDSGSQAFEYGGAHDVSAITCMTFDPKGRRLITGGRDGCLKIWNFNNGQCLKTLQRDGECLEVYDCTYLTAHSNNYVMSVGRGRKIDIYADIPEDPHIQRPRPSWQDDLKNGHKDDILCVAQCPPSLLATGSYDGEIIVWNMISELIQCRFLSPPPCEHQNAEGLDALVSSLIFLRNSSFQQFASCPALLSSGATGCINVWNVLSGGKFVSSFKASRFQQKIIKLAKTGDDALLYAADRIGYIYVFNVEKIFLSSVQKPPTAENYWRAHISTITGLQIVDNDQVVLTSSTDGAVRLWSSRGEFIGTFGQSERWSIHFTSSWKHPAVPYEVLIDPLSMQPHEILNAKTGFSDVINRDDTG
ncbi:WD repeat-containing protein on Y chromosome [Thalassophryne amazonica]|uniref:WD repeat-containing protein on Y chromosome n=1 Tax=Thalassophryne amazonica TaxID=390379 RepID=UPI001471F788|nr:WD repeat-containing protein on Y chromosome [Thalassophryne amazonica]